ncbi:TRAP dicarboxylate transporter subunit DctP [Escherichia coli]|nr:TRAP dicarboxylate transporter subunit DctP [Escherichia coli]
MELIRSGAIPLVKTNAAEMEAFENSYKLFSLPYLFRDRDHYYQVMQGDIGRKILDSTKSKGYFGLTFYDGGARSFYGNKPVLKPDDLKGMKVRVQPSPGAVEMIKVMGGNPTPLDYGELYTALQQGVVDMAENSVMALTTMRHGEVAKSFSLDEHTMVPDVVLMSNAAFDKLSRKIRQLY